MAATTFEQNQEYLPPKKEEPALHRAARLGNGAMIRQLVASGAEINCPFDIGLDPGASPTMAVPLMVAAGSGYGATVETMRLLLELGADPSVVICNNSIARYAVGGLGWNYEPGGDAARLQLCLDLGCDSNELDDRGVTLLADACRMGDSERIRLLLNAKAKPDANDSEGNIWSFQIPLHNAVNADNAEAVELLIGAGANVHVLDRMQRSAIFSARSEAVTRILIDRGLNIESRDKFEWTPLINAIHEGSMERARMLIALGANVNGKHDRGFTVFMSAVGSSERKLDIMKSLIDAGADPYAVSDLGWNAFHAAIDVNGPDANSEESVRSTFEFLLQLGVDINHRDARGTTPLQRAESHGNSVEVNILRELGAC